MKKLYIILLALIFAAVLVFAYPVSIIVKGNTNFNTTVYHCQDASCSNLDDVYSSSFGNTNNYNINKLGDGTQYFAEYNFVLDRCYFPSSFIKWFDDSTGNGPWNYNINFSKKACTSNIISYSQKDIINKGEVQDILVNVSSPLYPPAGGPAALPLQLEKFYSANVKVNLEIKNSSGNLVYSNTLNNDVVWGKNNKFSFSFTPLNKGEYDIELKVYSDECMCSSSIITTKLSNFNVSSTLDTTSPEVIIFFPENIIYNYNINKIEFLATDNVALANCWYNLGAGNIPTDCSKNITGIISQEGSNKWVVGAKDTSGNIKEANVNFSVNISSPINDTIPPYVAFLSPENKTYNTSIIHIEINASSDVSSIFWNNGTANLTYTAPVNYIFSDGSHTLIAYAKDSAGNLNSTSISFSVNTFTQINDTTPPVITIIIPEEKEYDTNSILFKISTSEPVIEAWLLNNGANISMNADSLTLFSLIKTLDNGNYHIIFYAKDSAGNIGTAERNFSIDTQEKQKKNHNKNNENIIEFGEQLNFNSNILAVPKADLTNINLSSNKAEETNFSLAIFLSILVLLVLIIILLVLLSRRR